MIDPAELSDNVMKSAMRSVKANLAARSNRVLTSDEEDLLRIGIATGAQAMLHEITARALGEQAS
jgi:hypothetical protein